MSFEPRQPADTGGNAPADLNAAVAALLLAIARRKRERAEQQPQQTDTEQPAAR
jgi:hypothetical protein